MEDHKAEEDHENAKVRNREIGTTGAMRGGGVAASCPPFVFSRFRPFVLS